MDWRRQRRHGHIDRVSSKGLFGLVLDIQQPSSKHKAIYFRPFYRGYIVVPFTTTVDGRNPAPPGMYKTLYIMG